MAQRRMFSARITNSSRFLKMPATSQLLYFHLCMHADDDGVVEAWRIVQMAGFAEDDIKVLASREFVKVLNEDMVTFILDWTEHNLIRSDRKIDSIYKDLLLKIMPEADTIKAIERADTGRKTIKRMANNKAKIGGRPVDVKWTPNGPHRLGKVRLGKVRLGKVRLSQSGAIAPQGDPDHALIVEIIDAFEPVNPTNFKNWYKNKNQRLAIKRLVETHTKETVLKVIKILPQSNLIPFIPTVTTPAQLEVKWSDLEAGLRKEKAKSLANKPNVIL